jgi:predicted Zn-dependent protease
VIALGRRGFACGCCAVAGWLAAGCQTDGAGTRPQLGEPVRPGYRPPPGSDEAGLWAAVDKAEREIRTSRFVVRDQELNAYVAGIARRLTPDYAAETRIYVVRTPFFNASMAPNGMMQIWTGLLLRAQDEAQLATVIGHEMGHYLHRHSIQRWRDARDKADFATFLTLGLALAGPVGSIAGLAAQIAILASIFGYTREQEREADEAGFVLMSRAGYAPRSAAAIWEQLAVEEAASRRPTDRDPFFDTHPAIEERAATLEARAAGDAGGETRVDAYRAALRGHRATLFQDELRLRQYGRSLVIFGELAKQLPDDADVVFYTGEVYRLRDDVGDLARARDAYARALALREPAPEIHRSLGLVLRRQGDSAASIAEFRRYLELRPGAPDRALIQSYLTPS